jgi:hypothetical protein
MTGVCLFLSGCGIFATGGRIVLKILYDLDRGLAATPRT